MEKSPGSRSFILSVAALGLICLGAACLVASFPLGILAFRQVGSVVATSTPVRSPTAVRVLTTTPPGLATLQPPHTSSPSPVSETPVETDDELLEETEQLPSDESFEPEGSEPVVIPVQLDGWCVPWNSTSERAMVTRVIDGVTLEVLLDGETRWVRYIGVDLLEYEEDPTLWEKMTEKNRQLVDGRQILLVKGIAADEEDGEWLRYVIADGIFVNLEMVRSGYAIAQSTPPDVNCDELLLEAEEAAILGERGLWAPVPTPTRTLRPPTETASPSGPLVVVKVFQGTPWQEPDEFVEIYNPSGQPVQLEGWSISDQENHRFVFPNFILGPVQYCRVYTNLYAPENCGFSYYKPSPIWNNTGDCATLRDKNGRLIDEFCYD